MDLPLNLDEFDQVMGKKTKIHSLIVLLRDLVFNSDEFDEFLQQK